MILEELPSFLNKHQRIGVADCDLYFGGNVPVRDDIQVAAIEVLCTVCLAIVVNKISRTVNPDPYPVCLAKEILNGERIHRHDVHLLNHS